MNKKLLRKLTPKFLRSTFLPDQLFEGNDSLFKATLKNATVYGEYGAGASTIWVAKNIQCNILSTDSSSKWLDEVSRKSPIDAKLNLHYSNVGPIGKWGTPIGYEKAENFSDYTNWMWKQNVKPDVVLIDGRFRVCCFLTCLRFANEGTKLIFDDYTNRERYHYIEQFIKPSKIDGRQALFIVPNRKKLNVSKLDKSIEWFRYVTE
jgi:hypothetical protein